MNRSMFLFRAALQSAKAVLWLGLILCFVTPLQATTYYLAAGGTVTSTTSWWTNTNGTGSHPSNFTTAGNIFNIRNNATVTLTAAWTVSGAGSGVTIGDGSSACNFTIPSNRVLTGSILNVYANATLTLSNNTLPTLTSCVFDAASTVDFANSSSTTIPLPSSSTYGNLVVSGSGTTYTFGGSMTIAGNFSVTTANTVRFFGGATNAASYSITINGNYIQTSGTADGGANNATDPGGNNFNAYIYVGGDYNKSASGTLTNSSPNDYTCFIFNGGGSQSFTTGGTNDYVFCYVTNNSTLNLTTDMNLDATSLSKTTLTVDVGSTLDAATHQITTNVGSKSYEIDGTLRTQSAGGLCNAGTACIPAAHAPTTSLGSASLIEYYSTSTQTVTARTDYANVTITNNSTKIAVGACSLSGNLIINANATLDGSTYSHTIQGNFTNSGTFTPTTCTVTFNGTSTQSMLGSVDIAYYDLVINNSAGVKILGNINASVSHSLTLTSGLLTTTSSHLLIMKNGATTASISSAATSYVNGPMQYQKSVSGSTTLNFPVGKSPDCRPVELTVNHTDNTQYNYTAESFNANPWTVFGSGVNDMPATVDTISGVHYVTIDRTGSTGTSQPSAGLVGNQTIKMYFGTNDFVYQGSNLTIVKNTSATPATWIDIGGSCALGNSSSPQAGSVSSTSSPSAFISFSSFALGSKPTGWNSLPIELLDFTAVPNSEKVDIEWTTVTEQNNAYFTIEKSRDGKTFTKLIDVPGAGNSIVRREYFETDYQPYSGTSYYRIKQTDYNGNYKYFPAVAVNFDAAKNVVIYPNPVSAKDDIHVKVSGYEDEEVLVVLRDMQGHEYFSKILVSQAGNQTFVIGKPEGIPAGTYVIVASSNDNIYSYKLVIN